MYGITYEDDIKFFNEVYIKRYLYENKNNYELLEILCNHYRNSYNQGLNIDTIREYIRFLGDYKNNIKNLTATIKKGKKGKEGFSRSPR